MLIYSSSNEDVAERLIRAVESVCPDTDFEIYQSLVALTKRLRQPILYPTIVILLASSKEELQEMLPLRDLLDNSRIILILPDSDPQTLATGHTMKPRFMIDCRSNFKELSAVLSFMLRNQDLKKKYMFK